MNQIKRIAVILFVVAYAAAALAEPKVEDDRPAANVLLDWVESKYKSMKTYASKGTVVTDTALVGRPREKVPPMPFEIRLKRAGRFLIQWEMPDPQERSQRLAMWGDIHNEQVMVTSLDGGKPVKEDKMTSFAMMGALSGGAAQTIPWLYFNMSGPISLGKMIFMATYEKDQTIEGDECYVISGWLGPLKRVYWISKKTLLIRQHQQVFGDGAEAPELPDEYFNELSEAAGAVSTPEIIAQYRESFKRLADDRSDQVGTITETHKEIAVDKDLADKQLAPADIEDE